MTDTVSEARRLRAEGVPITTLDGQEFRLIFDVEAVAEIEDAFGSLGAMQDELQALSTDLRNAKVFKPLLTMMRAGLIHDPSARNVRFDSALVNEYFAAVMKATDLAFPKAPMSDPPGDTPPITDTGAFHGPTSITSLPSNSDEVMARSGG